MVRYFNPDWLDLVSFFFFSTAGLSAPSLKHQPAHGLSEIEVLAGFFQIRGKRYLAAVTRWRVIEGKDDFPCGNWSHCPLSLTQSLFFRYTVLRRGDITYTADKNRMKNQMCRNDSRILFSHKVIPIQSGVWTVKQLFDYTLLISHTFTDFFKETLLN